MLVSCWRKMISLSIKPIVVITNYRTRNMEMQTGIKRLNNHLTFVKLVGYPVEHMSHSPCHDMSQSTRSRGKEWWYHLKYRNQHWQWYHIEENGLSFLSSLPLWIQPEKRVILCLLCPDLCSNCKVVNPHYLFLNIKSYVST